MDHPNILSKLYQAGLKPPETLTIAITDTCNLDCAHCWVDAGSNPSRCHVPIDALRTIISDFADLGGVRLRLTGGEPLLHPDWFELLGYAGSLGLHKIILQTNGMLFTAVDILAISELNLKVLEIQISLDGANAEDHDFVRGEGAFQQTLAALDLLAKAGLGAQVSIFMTEMRHNLQGLPELLGLAAILGVGSVSSGCLVQCGRADLDTRVQPPEPAQYIKLLEHYREDEGFRQLYEKMGCVAAIEWCSAQHSDTKCCHFIQSPYLTRSGLLYPCLMCHADSYCVRDVYGKGLAVALVDGIPLWTELLSISQLRSREIPECQSCSLLSRCGGGCMGRTWGSFGDFMHTEDRCEHRQLICAWSKTSG